MLEAQPGRYDTSSLRIVFCAAAQLEAELVSRARRTLGEKLYNFYGSTEVAYATFATPEDLRLAPGTPAGCRSARSCACMTSRAAGGRAGPLRPHLRQQSLPVRRVYRRRSKELIDGLMSTGDVGHFDAAGRLFVDGRDDEMIVSGGENLFPSEVEELLITHQAIEEASAIGVEERVRQAAGRLRRAQAGDGAHRGTGQGLREGQPGPVQGAARVTFLDELPRTPTGKVLKRELRERHASD